WHPGPPASNPYLRPTTVVIAGPRPRFVGHECPTAVVAFLPAAVSVGRPAAGNFRRLPACAPLREFDPSAMRVKRFAAIEVIALYANFIRLLINQSRRQPFITFPS